MKKYYAQNVDYCLKELIQLIDHIKILNEKVQCQECRVS